MAKVLKYKYKYNEKMVKVLKYKYKYFPRSYDRSLVLIVQNGLLHT